MNEIVNKLRRFNADRNWDQFHSPKNLVMALMVEVAELAEIMIWKTQEETRDLMRGLERNKVLNEIGDILIYTIILADRFNIDIEDAINRKIILNSRKYPVELAKGSNKKYTELKKRGGGITISGRATNIYDR
jgi:NTP pyrophosphatase (non-canonical NTP hydrolase)